MDFDESEDTTLLRDTLRRFLDRELPREAARRHDQAATHPQDVFQRLCGLGVSWAASDGVQSADDNPRRTDRRHSRPRFESPEPRPS